MFTSPCWRLALVLCLFSCSALQAQEPAPAAGPVPVPKHKHTNRLAKETSPYLLLHAHNPVNWYPWGEEALTKARKENKLIFLSVGYSSCHWCHVMERESFLDEEIAALLNEHFVCIKIDREERPEIDTIYMTSLQVFMQLSGQGRGGGWPLSMFLTPKAEPFFGGTYFPARDGDRAGMPGFLTVAKKVQGVWADEPDKIAQDAAVIAEFTKKELETRPELALTPIDAATYDGIQAALQKSFDPKYGGFGYSEENPRMSKFPEPPNLVFLLDRVRRTAGEAEKQKESQTMLAVTLDNILQGGIYDHLGGGFHRYSTDRMWQIPHFEKMLYDNGQLASVYAEAYAQTGREEYARVTRETLEFVLREMTSPEGGFYAALDAESESEEGKFYRWSKEELEAALTPEEFKLAAPIYSFDGEPNFDDHYCLQLSQSWAALAKERETTIEKLHEQLAPVRAKLLAVRNKRPRPLTDDKILTAQNGLMIRGFADAGRILKDPRYLEAASRAAQFALDNLRNEDGRLYRSHAKGQASLNGYLEDYAFLVDGLLALHQATGDAKWLTAADELTVIQLRHFEDEKHGGFFFTAADHEALLARIKEFGDNVQPSANAVAAQNLLTLAAKLEKPAYREAAQRTLKAGAGILQRRPLLSPYLAVVMAKSQDEKK